MIRLALRDCYRDPSIQGISLLERLYRARGVESGRVDYDLSRLESPATLKDCDKAAGLLGQAIESGKNIVVVGDYDADGATSTALCMLAFRAMGARAGFYVPDRFSEGYGLSPEVLESCMALEPDLILTVDNGISSLDGVALANSRHIPVIVTDHHLAGESLPEAAAIVNPNQPGCDFPWKSTCGVGVVFYVLAALRKVLLQRGWFERQGLTPPRLSDWLDVVALGTVADVVPLELNNRILVAQGLRRIRAGRCRPGIKALVSVSGRQLESITSLDLGFAIGPRLNAAGRLEDISKGIHCLLTDSEEEAADLAAELDQLNRTRREVEADMRQRAEEIVARLQTRGGRLDQSAVCLYDKHWHEGVVGLVASRIKESQYRPVIAFAPAGDGLLKGSGRSIPGFHLRDALEAISTANPGLILKFGGHAMAAGLSIAPERLPHFETAFLQYARQHLDDSLLKQTLLTDGELKGRELSLHSAWEVAEAGPWGQGFPEPLFEGRFRVKEERWLADRHLKLRVVDTETSRDIDAIAFNWQGGRAPLTGKSVRMAYRLTANTYRDITRLQLVIEHLEAV